MLGALTGGIYNTGCSLWVTGPRSYLLQPQVPRPLLIYGLAACMWLNLLDLMTASVVILLPSVRQHLGSDTYIKLTSPGHL
jgi:hypothetical protein